MSELVRLAAPIIVSRAGILVMAAVDTVMVGQYSTPELAYMSIGSALIIPIMLISMGLTMGTLVLTANSHGANDTFNCGAIWRRSVPYAFGLGLVAVGICYFGPFWLALAGQSPRLATEGGAVMRVMGFGLPGYLLFMTSVFFLEGVRRPLPCMFIMIAANLLNFALNGWFISGGWGLEAQGAIGATWATSISRWFLGGMVIGYIWWMKDQARFGIRIRRRTPWASWSDQRRLGYATALSIGVEATAFAALNIFAGWMGEAAVAAYSIGINVLSLLFMIALGIGVASSVRVGIAYGRRDYPDTALAGWTGIGVSTLCLGLAGTLVCIFSAEISSFYTSDQHLVEFAQPLIFLCGLAIVLDGGQAVMANVLRGRKDVWIPSGLQTLSYIGLLIPLSWTLSIYLGHGPNGLFEAILLTSVFALSLLALRFYGLCLGDRARS
ncbi:MAG: MATE family efflux transporter [Rhodospirillales bacterium]|nr:MATE family efflux transporter [Rhodospirillales bacterium]